MLVLHKKVESLNSTFANHEHTKKTKEQISESTLEYHVQRIEDGAVKQTYHDMWEAVEWVKKKTPENRKQKMRVSISVFSSLSMVVMIPRLLRDSSGNSTR